jgi:hypothetical protein
VDLPPPDCRLCAHYYVTHEASWPHGCRAFELKSRRLPCLVVRESSGAECRAFTAREDPAIRRKGAGA